MALADFLENYYVTKDGRTVPRPRCIIGLDLGQAKDYSAMCVLDQFGRGSSSSFHCTYLERLPLKSSYPEIVETVSIATRRYPITEARSIDLVIDATGVGRSVYDQFVRAKLKAHLTGIQITAGNEVTFGNPYTNTPKKELVGAVQTCLQPNLQTGVPRLKFASDVPDLEVLRNEIQNFNAERSETGHASFGAREGEHDDLVLALAIGLWYGCNRQEWYVHTGAINF